MPRRRLLCECLNLLCYNNKAMESTHRTPQHTSYRRHQRQRTWQIIVPIVSACLLLVAVTYLISVATFRDNADVARWAEISTMWLSIPVAIMGFVMLIVVAALAYLVGRLAGFIPPYTLKAQLFAYKVEAGAHRVSEIGHEPKRIIPELGRLIRAGLRRVRRR
jgi:heme/copper-type cytochrome/quinol oxidase subunit 2